MRKKILSIFLVIAMIVPILNINSFAKTDDKKLNYVVLGDSIAMGFAVLNRDKAAYGKIIADTNDYNYVNYGIDGLRSWDLIDQLKYDDSVVKSVTEADIISLSIGGNDFLQQDLVKVILQVSQGNYKILNDVERNFIEYFATIIDEIKALNPDVTLLVQTLYNPRWDFLRDFFDEAVVRVNNTILNYYSENPDAFYLVDVHSVFTKDHPEYIAIDTVHPSAVGNVVIARIVQSKLCEIGLSDTEEIVVKSIGIDELPFSSYLLYILRIILFK